MSRIVDYSLRGRILVGVLVASLCLLFFREVGAEIVDQRWSDKILADKDGVPIEGVSPGTAEHYMLEKASKVGPGKYTVFTKGVQVGRFTIKPDVAAPEPEPEPEPVIGLVQCPNEPTSVTGSRTWTLCDIKSADKPEYSANGSDYLMSYRIPSAVTTENKAQLYVYMHPSTSGDQFVSGSSSFDHSSPSASRQIEIHTLEQTVGVNPNGDQNSGGWWGWSGYSQGAADNYNGQLIVESIRHIVKQHGDIIDLDKGIKLGGVSLGGAGAYIQAQLLKPLLAELSDDLGVEVKVASAVSFWGIQNMIEADEAKVKTGWGTQAESPELYAATDLRANWADVQNLHFHWAGGQNDGLGRMSTDFMDVCELRKISCSMRWLQSGHGAAESGYDLPHGLWLDPNQDVTLDVILPVITNNTANHRGELRGYINRNISWDYANIVDSVDEIQVPLKYIAAKNIGPELPDQPDSMTFSLTLRHVANFDTQVGRKVDWVFGDQSGTTEVGSDGLLTVDGLTLPTGDSYTVFSVKKHDGGAVVLPEPELVAGVPDYVYTRVPRTLDDYVTDTYTAGHMDHLDRLPEVGAISSGFNAPGQLVLSVGGVETIIYDCMDAEKPCVPNDPAVSFDKEKILFSVMSSDNLVHTYPPNREYPNIVLGTKNNEAKMFSYTIATGELVPWPHTAGVVDSGPTWLPDGRVMFTSTRNPQYGPSLRGIGSEDPKPRLFIADADGSNAVDISPHEVSGALHPYTLDSGDVAYSSHWMSHNLPYISNNSGVNWPGTTTNFWAVTLVNYLGGDQTLLLGSHRNRLGVKPSSDTMKALHFFGQRANGDFCAVNYYRANNLGSGDIICLPLPRHGIEGPVPTFLPEGMYSLAKWASSEDNPSFKDSDGKYLGKIGWPEGDTDGQMVVTYAEGYCTRVSLSIPSVPSKIEASGSIGCDAGIYKTSVIPSQHPTDLVKLVDSPEWHEFGARVIKERNISTPTLASTSDGSCQLVSTDAGVTDAHNYNDYKFNSNYKAMANNGGEIQGLPHEELAAIRFYEVLPNVTKKAPFKNHMGNELKLLGDVPLLEDKSFKASLPCDTPYVMAGVDEDGLIIKRDQLPQSLRPGEKRVCSGCHLHSEEGRPYEQSLAFNAEPFILSDSIPTLTYSEDIKPIFEEKCSSCHTPEFLDYDNLVWDYLQKTVPEADKVQVSTSTNENRRYGLQRPYTSKNVNNMFARESLLYWKIANARTDGRTDETYDDDIDFKQDHPTQINPTELKAVGLWLDSGASR